MKLARTLFIIFVVFAACWTPYAIIIVLDYSDTYPQVGELMAEGRNRAFLSNPFQTGHIMRNASSLNSRRMRFAIFCNIIPLLNRNTET